MRKKKGGDDNIRVVVLKNGDGTNHEHAGGHMSHEKEA